MPSKDYERALEEARGYHQNSKVYSGKFLRPHKPFLQDMIDRLGITSALDYGCGKGAQYSWVDPGDGMTMEEAFGFEVFKFDPAWPPFATDPDPDQKFDLVMCTHTLGAIPEGDHEWVLPRLFGHATKAVYIAEKVGPIKKKMRHHDGLPSRNGIAWRVHLRDIARAHPNLEVWLSLREKRPEGVIVERWKMVDGYWALQWDSENQS